MNSPECLQVLFNFLQNVEKRAKEIHETQEKTQSSQIKGEFQLKDLSEAIEFITKKFDQYESEMEAKRENYKWSTGEGFRNVKWNRGTEEFIRLTAAVLKTKLRPHSWDTRVKMWRYGWASSKNNQRRTWGNSWKIQFRSNASTWSI